jgi:hypothetical protein
MGMQMNAMTAWNLILIFVFGTELASAHGDEVASSAKRDPAKSYLEYVPRADSQQSRNNSSRLTPYSVALPFKNALLPKATAWESQEVLFDRFRLLRDLRWLEHPSRPGFLRRSTWLYPDDGCFARAALIIKNSQMMGFPQPSKVFAFGDLRVSTPNAPGGSVTWWYHVAAIVEVNDRKYVLDPSILPSMPLELSAWLAKMNPNYGDLYVSICKSGAYNAGDDCYRSSDGIEARATSDQSTFLDDEWLRLENLVRNPEMELGNYPPW